MIRREGKARWVYECKPCDARAVQKDLLRVTEARNAHERTISHAAKALGAALQPLVDAYGAMAKVIVEAGDQVQGMYALAPNRPHDPALLNDKRKWGGK